MAYEIENGDLTVHEFMQDWKIGRPKVEYALNELQISDLPSDWIYSNYSRYLTLAIQEQICSFLNLVHPAELGQLIEQGFVPLKELPKKIEIPLPSISRYINNMYGSVSEIIPNYPIGKRRAYLVPPWVISDTKRYEELGNEREMLGAWRSLKTRGLSWIIEISSDAQTATKLLNASDIIRLEESDVSILENIRNTDTIAEKYRIIAEMAIFNNDLAVKNADEISEYLMRIIPGLLVKYKSKEDFEAILHNKIFDFTIGKAT